jgi:uncharacterized protein YhaN
LLRDEGSITGQTGEGLKDKLDAIKAYYAHKLAAVTARKERLEVAESELQQKLVSVQSRLFEAEVKQQLVAESFPLRTAIPWLQPAAMLLIWAVMIVANYFFIARIVRPFTESWWMPVAIMGVGMFVLFGQDTIWANAEADKTNRHSRMKWLIELLPATVAAMLVGCLAWEYYPVSIVIGSLLFTYVLFLFCGKLVINLKVRLFSALKTRRDYVLKCREYEENLKKADKPVDTLAKELSKLQSDDEELVAAREGFRTLEIALLKECEVKCSVFLSEYHFSAALNAMTGNPISPKTPSDLN